MFIEAASGSQQLAQGFIGVVVAAAALAVIGLLLFFFVRNFFAALSESPGLWLAIWGGIAGVVTLGAATAMPSFPKAVGVGLVVATAVVVLWLALIAIFDS